MGKVGRGEIKQKRKRERRRKIGGDKGKKEGICTEFI